jgi:hypothetical protein
VIEDVSFHDVRITYDGGGTAEEARRQPEQVAGEYFEIGTPPAYGLYARNVRGLNIHNVRFEVEQPDLRPAVVLDHVSDAAMNGLAMQGNPEAKSALRFIDTHDVLVTAPRVLTPAAVFLAAEGSATRAITVDGGDLSKAATPCTFEGGATKATVTLRA